MIAEDTTATPIDGHSDSPREVIRHKPPRSAWRLAALGGAIVAGFFIWAYWTTIAGLAGEWDRQPDYSHGYLVVPAALFFLWARRERFPGFKSTLSWPGLVLIAISIAMRYYSARFYFEAIDGWSIMIWAAGVVWLLCGWKVLCWSLPSIAFLFFMVPLPFRVERWMSLPLQGAATKLSCWGLQLLGQPALAQGHTILLGDFTLEVEQACSGLRIFVGIVALAFAYMAVAPRAWLEKAVILLCIVPIALISNASRIITTGLLYQLASADAAKQFSHDAAGWMMIVLSAGLFGLLLLYVKRLVREVELVDVGAIVRKEE
jgi:exosortase